MDFREILYEIYSRVPFIEWLLCLLCEIEMQVKLLKLGEDYKHNLSFEGCKIKLPNETIEEYEARSCYTQIPKDTLFCNGCPYAIESSLAKLFFGPQQCGYCYYLGKGDFSYIRPTFILWDGCKECGIYEFIKGEDCDS